MYICWKLCDWRLEDRLTSLQHWTLKAESFNNLHHHKQRPYNRSSSERTEIRRSREQARNINSVIDESWALQNSHHRDPLVNTQNAQQHLTNTRHRLPDLWAIFVPQSSLANLTSAIQPRLNLPHGAGYVSAKVSKHPFLTSEEHRHFHLDL